MIKRRLQLSIMTALSFAACTSAFAQSPILNFDFSYGRQVDRTLGIQGESINSTTAIPDRKSNDNMAISWGGTDSCYYLAGEHQDTTISSGSGLTLSAWVKPNLTLFNGEGSVVTKWNVSHPNATKFGLWINDGGNLMFRHYIFAPTAISTSTSNSTVPSNTWSHIAVTIDYQSTELKFFINGSEVQSQILGAGLVTTQDETKLSVGAQHNDVNGTGEAPSNFFVGSVDDVLGYNESLTATQIDSIYNAQPRYCEDLSVTISNIQGTLSNDGSLEFKIKGGKGSYAYQIDGGSFVNVTSGSLFIVKNENFLDSLFAPANTVFTNLNFASFGLPILTLTTSIPQYGTCHSANSYSILEPQTIDSNYLRILGTNFIFGGDPCSGMFKKIAVITSYAAPTEVSGLSAGNHVLTITDDLGCTTETAFTIPATVTIPEQEAAFKLYPNPANEMITLEGKTKINSIQVLNIAGKVVKRFDHLTNNTIDIADIEAGVYLISATFENGMSSTKRVIVQ